MEKAMKMILEDFRNYKMGLLEAISRHADALKASGEYPDVMWK